ncbi:MAG: hypothetical protein KC434_16475 [Anaerolineales bacterium]|nr:hypothetical protein [Anaerolineales bacterium]
MIDSFDDLPVILAGLTQQIKSLNEAVQRMEGTLTRRHKQQDEDITANRADIADLTEGMAQIKLAVAELQAWQTSHDRFRCPFIGQPALNVVQVALEKLLIKHFTKDEIIGVAFELNVSDSVHLQQTKQMMAISLVMAISHQNRLPALLSHLQNLRPTVIWPILFEETN